MNRRPILLALMIVAFAGVAHGAWPGLHAPWRSPAPGWYVDRASADHASGPDRVVVGRPMATQDRARDDLKLRLRDAVADWLADAGVPRDWSPAPREYAGLVRETFVERVDRDYGTVYVAACRADFSADRRDELIASHDHEVVGRRIGLLAGGLALCLLALVGAAGYVRADEATRGYYTVPLRIATLAAVGGAGYFVARLMV